MSLTLGVMSFTASTASAQGGDFGNNPANGGGNSGFNTVGQGQINLISDLPFGCSSITITSVNGQNVTADACGKPINITAVGNTSTLFTGTVIQINNPSGHLISIIAN